MCAVGLVVMPHGPRSARTADGWWRPDTVGAGNWRAHNGYVEEECFSDDDMGIRDSEEDVTMREDLAMSPCRCRCSTAAYRTLHKLQARRVLEHEPHFRPRRRIPREVIVLRSISS